MSDVATEFQSAVIAEIERQAKSENIQQLIAKKVGEVMTESISSAFRSYGDVGKQIENAIKESLQINDRLDLPRYGVMVLAVLRQKLDERVHTIISERLDSEMDEILSIAPKELKFSKLVEEVVKNASENMHDRYGTYITCIVEHDDRYADWINVWLDSGQNVDKRDCEIRFTVSKDGALLSCHLDGKDPKKTIRMGGMWGYQKMIFGAYCCGSKVIMDELEPSTGIGDF